MGCNYRPVCCQVVESPVAEMREDLHGWSLLSSPWLLPTVVRQRQPNLLLGSPLGGENMGQRAGFAHH